MKTVKLLQPFMTHDKGEVVEVRDQDAVLLIRQKRAVDVKAKPKPIPEPVPEPIPKPEPVPEPEPEPVLEPENVDALGVVKKAEMMTTKNVVKPVPPAPPTPRHIGQKTDKK